MNQAIERMKRELSSMAAPLEGACLCGAVTYVCASVPVWSGHCHCRECQMLSGAPFVSAFSVEVRAFKVLGGVQQFRRRAASGGEVTTSHCAACGTRLFAQSTANPPLVSIFATTLRDPRIFRPVGNVYLSEAVAWVEPPAAIFNFQRMPPKAPEAIS